MSYSIRTNEDYQIALQRLAEIWNMDACQVDTGEAETLLAAIAEYELINNMSKNKIR